MQSLLQTFRKIVLPAATLLPLTVFTLPVAARAQSPAPAEKPVTITDDGAAFVLANAYLTARVSKTTGDLVSLKYHNLETMGYLSGHHAGYWEQNPSGAPRLVASLTIDPKTNSGDRGEVSVKGFSDGKSLTSNPRPDPAALEEHDPAQERPVGPPPGSTRAPNAGTNTGRGPGSTGAAGGQRGPGSLFDLEIRYTLGRSDHGIYTYAIFTHQPTYGATQIGESRYGFKLSAKVFDWLSVDQQRNDIMPTGEDWDRGTDLNMKEARRLTTGVHKGRAEHKYDYCADQFDTPAFGWSSTHDHIGLYFINPSMEYLSSGPQHFELTGHLDDGDGGDPTLLDYWRGTHYGGSSLPIAANEDWNKVVGPIFVYLNSAPTPNAMFADARAQAVREAARWPYSWVSGVDFPQAPQRSIVTGQLLLEDPQAASKLLPNLLVGLAYPDEKPAAPAAEGQGRGAPQPLTWQSDAKHYEFWVHASPDGRFSMPNVRPGTYQLHAIADGVLGAFDSEPITVAAGKPLNLGQIAWKPVRYGRQLWQIGIPNRSASEFFMGNDHWHWGLYVEYSKLFPNDIDYTIGKSDFRKDWFIYQVPHATGDASTGQGQGRATTWTVHFDIPAAPASGALPPKGQAILRLGISGASARSIDVGVNGRSAGSITGLIYNATINRDGVQGSWVEKDLPFDTALLHPGVNTLTLTVPAGGLTSGIAYDVVRLEIAPTP